MIEFKFPGTCISTLQFSLEIISATCCFFSHGRLFTTGKLNYALPEATRGKMTARVMTSS